MLSTWIVLLPSTKIHSSDGSILRALQGTTNGNQNATDKSSESASLAEEMHQVYDRLARRFTAFSRKTEYISYITYLDFI